LLRVLSGKRRRLVAKELLLRVLSGKRRRLVAKELLIIKKINQKFLEVQEPFYKKVLGFLWKRRGLKAKELLIIKKITKN